MLRELSECSHKIKEERKVTLSEVRKNIQRTNSEGKEGGSQINNLEEKEEINIQREQQEEKRISKNEDSIRTLWTSPNLQTSES